MGVRGRKSAADRDAEAFSIAHRAPKSSAVTRDAPSHLCKEGASFFVSMRQAYEIEDPASVATLTRAAECIDRIAAAARASEGRRDHREPVRRCEDEPSVCA